MYYNRIVQEDLSSVVGDGRTLSDFANHSILITGVNGMIGSYLAMSFLKANDLYDLNIHVYALARNVAKAKDRFSDLLGREDFEVVGGDLSILDVLELKISVDLIIHAASQTSPNQFIHDPVGTALVNTIGTAKLLDLAVKKKAKRFLLLSTREIYGNNYQNLDLVSEDDYGPMDHTNLRSCYPESKKAAENLCMAYAEQYDIDVKFARIAHTYGPSMLLGDGRVVGDFINNTVRNEPIIMNSDGSGKLALTYITDIVKGIFILLNINKYSICNISNDREIITVKELAETLNGLRSTGIESKIQRSTDVVKLKGYLTTPPGFLDSSKIKSSGWECSVKLEDGLRRVIEYYQDKNAGR